MGSNSNLNRRKFIGANLCVAAGLITPGSVAALERNNWATVTATEFNAFNRQSFFVQTDDNRRIRLRLIKTEASNSGPARPAHLARAEGLTAVFVTTQADAAWLAEAGHQSVNIWHETLGNGRVFIGAVPSRRGGYFVEMVLN